MQPQSWARLVPAVALAAQLCLGYHTKLHSVLQQQATAASSSGAWAALVEAETDDRRFWGEQWSAMEAALLELQDVAGGVGAKGVALLQAEAGNATSAPSGTAHAGNASAIDHAEPKEEVSPLAGLKLNLNPKTTAELAPALAMLKALYEDGKERITQLNAREKQSKQRYEDMKKQHDTRLATIEARFKNGTLSAEFHKNETRDEMRIWNYWERVRERQHRQFHTSLKIQHGTMSKVKTMIDMYEKTMSGKASEAEVQKDLAKVTGAMPEVVLLQQAWRAQAPYFHEALTEVRTASAELEPLASPDLR
uniref:Uncharacterized protein n=1 Tax=Alexandrium andersonii TaxID=327968 RepID=A0A7S2N7A9_9DINO